MLGIIPSRKLEQGRRKEKRGDKKRERGGGGGARLRVSSASYAYP